MNEPLISVIIPAKNCEKTIEKCIISVLSLDYPRYEVIFINDGSGDKTGDILNRYNDRLCVLTNTLSRGPSQARNIAALRANGLYLAFTDADCIVDKNWLKELLKPLQGQDRWVVSAGGIQAIPADESAFGRRFFEFTKKINFFTDYTRAGSAGMNQVNHNPSCNVMYRKDVFLEEKGFFEGLWPGEDVELDYRLTKKGYKLIFNPRAIVFHYRCDNLRSFLRMMFRYGRAQAFLVKKYGIFRRVHFLPLFTAGALILFLYLLLNHLAFFITAVVFVACISFWYVGDVYTLRLAVCAFASWHAGFIKGFLKRGI